jgi:hypothetical protein
MISAFGMNRQHPEECAAKLPGSLIAANCNFIIPETLDKKMTIMKRLISCGLILLSMAVQAQQEKNLVMDANAEVRTVSGFTAIDVSGAIDLYLSQGKEEAVAVSASSEEIRSRIKTEVSNGVLRIYFDGKGLNWKRWGNNRMKAYITFIRLNRIEASGACNVKTTDPIQQPELKLEMSGASDFTGEVKLEKLRLDASGASNIQLKGTTTSVIVDASGASVIKCYDLQSETAKVNASGASSIRITVNKELSADASGGSTLFYKGTGLIRDISSSGGASIKKRSDD